MSPGKLTAAIFADLPTGRRREVMSAVAHTIAGVLPWEAMVGIVESLTETSELRPGDRVKTLRGTLRGVIVRLLGDGRVAWRPDGANNDLTALPEGLCRDE